VARPARADLEAVAKAGPGRREGEEFAILMAHALADTTPDNQGDFALFELVESIGDEGVPQLTTSRRLRGTATVAGTRSWLRSRVEDDGVVTVMLIEHLAAEALQIQGRPFEFWTQVMMQVVHDGREWRVTDYVTVGASESVDFSDPVWENVMDSGKGWRRFLNR
jgi:hypothetical protein